MLSLQHGVLFGFRSESVHTIFDADFCCFFPRVAFAQQPFRKALDTFSVWIAEIGYSFFIIFFSLLFFPSLCHLERWFLEYVPALPIAYPIVIFNEAFYLAIFLFISCIFYTGDNHSID